MKSISLLIAPLLFVIIAPVVALADGLPKTITSSPCRTAPEIDGRIGDEEWKDAKAIEFELPMLKVIAKVTAPRVCRLRVMNSANGLYVALSIPDETVNKSLAPLDFDLALLAFCRGKELAAGDDRKAVGPGIFIDKHVTTPGKDADDKKQDGRAVMVHDQGTYSIEWAMPLDSGDVEDLRVKPGDAVRFNLAYFDAFQADLKETQIGTAYPGGLDRAGEWGTLQLAANVEHDGGVAFQGPVWVRKLFESFRSVPANRLRLIETTRMPSTRQPVIKALVEFTYRDPRGKETIGKGKLFFPETLQEPATSRPLFFGAGYELDDASAAGHVERGFVVATPRALEANPLVRTINPDAALLHIVRSLPFVDDARVVIAGGSAGGYATLLLAAETFPLSGAAPDVPPVNWGYNAAYFLQKERGQKQRTDAPKTPVFDVIIPIVKQGLGVYGDDTSGETYFRNSPLAHLETITCPVSVYWTTADMLVPIDQVGPKWVRPFDAKKFPAEFTFDPTKLTTSPAGRMRVVEVLKETDYELFELSEETVKQRLAQTQSSKQPAELPFSADKRWSITILDEGAPEPQVGHTKYPVPWSQRKFIDKALATKIAAEQLTSAKLERLMGRYAGQEWLPSGGLTHLDDPESERSDVLRGLKTYVAVSPDHARMFADLYAKLPASRRVLPAEIVAKFGLGK
ncbi:MAG: acetylxylan esterase [Planctomycetaceae bacterium]|nr:acetylxylan esterase [Planctomycetaceae bacterium]